MAAAVRAPKRARFSSNIVTIKAGTGDKQQAFSIHEDIVKETSAFFRAALNKRWTEGQTRKIELPEDDPEIVACYVDWCYSKGISSAKPGPITELSNSEIAAEHTLLAKLYIFGEKAQDDGFCDAIIAAMTEAMDVKFCEEGKKIPTIYTRYLSASTVNIIYQGTSANSPGRRFVVDIYASYGEVAWLQGVDAYLNTPEFLRDLAITKLSTSSRRKPGEKIFDRRKEWFKEKNSS